MRYGGVGSQAEIFEAIMLSVLNSQSRKERGPYHGEPSLATSGQCAMPKAAIGRKQPNH